MAVTTKPHHAAMKAGCSTTWTLVNVPPPRRSCRRLTTSG